MVGFNVHLRSCVSPATHVFLQEVIRDNGRADVTFFEHTARFGEITLQAWSRLRLIDRSEVPNYCALDSFPEPKDPRYPTLCFTGKTTGLASNEAMLFGSAAMSDAGVVRWRFVCSSLLVCRCGDSRDRFLSTMDMFAGGEWLVDEATSAHARTSSEGVQVGGIASAAGVVGAWSGVHHERGPFFPVAVLVRAEL